MKIHLHKWVELVDVCKKDNLYVNRRYRHCAKCCKWQRFCGSWSEVWWEDSDTPEGVEDLIPDDIATEMFHQERMERNARR